MGAFREIIESYSDNRGVTETVEFFYRKKEGCWVGKSRNAKLCVFDSEKTMDGGIIFRTLRMIPIKGMGALPEGAQVLRIFKGCAIFTQAIPLSRKAPFVMIELIKRKDEHPG